MNDNHTSSSGIAGNNRQGRSITCQHGWQWPLEHRAGENPQGRVTTLANKQTNADENITSLAAVIKH